MLSKHNNLLAFGEDTVTISLKGVKTGLNRIDGFAPVLVASGASTANKCPVITYVISDDKKTVDIYCWKHTSTSNPTLIAATDAVQVGWSAIGE